MKIKIGNIFESTSDTIVNTVNCVGVMGKGIALEFKKRYPEMYKEYVQLCENKELKPGYPYYYRDLHGTSIINFPTKDHWRSPSKLSYISKGLDWFRDNYEALGIRSVAFPPLGCGNGGLPWAAVGPLMYEKLSDLPIEIEIYAPYGTSSEQLTEDYLKGNTVLSGSELIGNKTVRFNRYWLLIIYTIQKLNSDRYALNVGRTIFQKVCYILTRVGVPTGFRFEEGSYGPYSKDVKEAVTVLSNANLISEQRLGKMIETVVPASFVLPSKMFTGEELRKTNLAIDLLSRIKNTDHAEMVTTVLFSYDELKKEANTVTDIDVFNHVMTWKSRKYKNSKEEEVCNTIDALSSLGWMSIVPSGQMVYGEDVF